VLVTTPAHAAPFLLGVGWDTRPSDRTLPDVPTLPHPICRSFDDSSSPLPFSAGWQHRFHARWFSSNELPMENASPLQMLFVIWNLPKVHPELNHRGCQLSLCHDIRILIQNAVIALFVSQVDSDVISHICIRGWLLGAFFASSSFRRRLCTPIYASLYIHPCLHCGI